MTVRSIDNLVMSTLHVQWHLVAPNALGVWDPDKLLFPPTNCRKSEKKVTPGRPACLPPSSLVDTNLAENYSTESRSGVSLPILNPTVGIGAVDNTGVCPS